MCFGGGGGNNSPQKVYLNDPSNGNTYYVEAGVPLDYAIRGATTTAAYQTMASQDLADKQIAAQKEIADKQDTFNQQQLQYQKDLQAQEQAQADAQAKLYSDYQTGRAQALDTGAKQIQDAFAKFSPDYYNKYVQDYMSPVGDQLSYQRAQADKQMNFGLARQGLLDSQARANETGLLTETQGRSLAEETQAAQQAAAQLQSNVGAEKQSLLQQVASVQGTGAPIGTTTTDAVNQALTAQRNQISGITSSAGDVIASLQGVPQVPTLSNIFAGVINSGGSYLQGANLGANVGGFGRGFAGSPPAGSSGSTTTR